MYDGATKALAPGCRRTGGHADEGDGCVGPGHGSWHGHCLHPSCLLLDGPTLGAAPGSRLQAPAHTNTIYWTECGSSASAFLVKHFL